MHLVLPHRPGVQMGVHMPGAVPGRWENGQEVGNGLPPYAQIHAHPVDDYPGLPEDWARSGDGMASYVVGLREGRGMWFDFRSLVDLEREMAVRLSVQGVCALSGHPTDVENGGDMHLIQFRNRCLVHPHVAFGPDRFCSECGRKWPAQNYLSTTGSHARFGVVMWIDGYRKKGGEVRQFLITPNKEEGIAYQILGDKCTPYYEVALFEGVGIKPPKPPRPAYAFGNVGLEGCFGGGEESVPHSFGTKGIGGSSPTFRGGGLLGSSDRSASPMRSSDVRQLHIGAGAIINQVIGDDPMNVDFWQPQPVGRFRLYFMPEEQLAPIIKAGRRVAEEREGFLGGLKVIPPGSNKTT